MASRRRRCAGGGARDGAQAVKAVKAENWAGLAIAGAVGLLAWKAYQGLKSAGSSAAQFISTSLNPASSENLVYSALSSPTTTPGTDWWTIVNPVQSLAETQAVGAQPTPEQTQAAVFYAEVNPATVPSAPTTDTTGQTGATGTADTYAPMLQFTPPM